MNSIGPNIRAALRPSAVPLPPESCSTSQEEAVKFIHVPVAEIIWPVRNRRKFRDPRADENVRRQAAVSRGLTPAAPRALR